MIFKEAMNSFCARCSFSTAAAYLKESVASRREKRANRKSSCVPKLTSFCWSGALSTFVTMPEEKNAKRAHVRYAFEKPKCLKRNGGSVRSTNAFP